MLSILCPYDTPRLRYTCELLFERLLGLSYQLRSPQAYQARPEEACLYYGLEEVPEGAFHLPHAGLLAQAGLQHMDLFLEKLDTDLPRLFSQPASHQYALDFDLFSAVFFLASEYEKYLELLVDAHGRYEPTAYPSHALSLHRLPLVHLYAAHLREALLARWPGLRFQPPSYPAAQLTIDVDVPWKFQHKPAWVFWGGWLKDLLTGNLQQAAERWQYLRSGQDPNDTFDWLFEHCPTDNTTFFFLIDGDSPHDSRFSWRLPAYQHLIKGSQAHGFRVGIHPSYHSFLDAARTQGEINALADLLGAPVQHARQHFLKYRHPHTFRTLEQLGIREDFTLCPFQRGGFPCGMAVPFPWYDLAEERASSLLLHPTIMMDWTLKHYLGHKPEEAVAHCRALKKTCQQVGGTFTFLLHNDALSEAMPWQGWRPSMEKILQEVWA